MSCASIGLGHWPVKCSSLSCLQLCSSFTPSKCFWEKTKFAHKETKKKSEQANQPTTHSMNSIDRYPNAAKAIFCSLFGIFLALILSIAIFTKFTPAYDVMHSLGTDMYIAPWTRILPYLIGVGSGYIMFTFNGVMPLGEVSFAEINYKITK